MRSPGRQRNRKKAIFLRDDARINLLAEQISYVGSPEHKKFPSFAGHPAPRADASICDASITQEQAQLWLREAMTRGLCGGMWEGEFPRYLWHKVGEQCYEARLVNQGNGQYKGYPIDDDEWPMEGGERT